MSHADLHADLHPDLVWAASGAMALTGPRYGTPRLAPGPLAACARDAVRRLASASGSAALARLDGAALLGERAALIGLERRGATAPGGHCRLLRARDGWLAVGLAREDDVALLPAWLEEEGGGDPWARVERGVRRRAAAELEARARLLGLPVAAAVAPDAERRPWLRVAARGPRRDPSPPARRPRVVDLSALWAGPLCGHLLGLAGAEVIKVESLARPDGARRGTAAFFDLLNAGKASVALDLATEAGRLGLAALVADADIVIEASRPRALAQLGIDAEALVARRPGLVWLGITGYGRREPEAGWVAFGDDAAVAAGLAFATGDRDAPLFCGDAVADPLTGIHAALAAWQAWRSGGGLLLDVALRDVAAHALAAPGPAERGRVRAAHGVPGGFEVVVGERVAPVAPPRARRPRARARPLGADTRRILEGLRAC